MRTVSKWGLVLGLLGVPAAAARSAGVEEKIHPREGAVELMLLRQKSVQDELKLSAAQVEKADAFAARQWKTAEEAHKLGGDRGKATFEQLGNENKKFIAETLRPEQQKRLAQIAMQVAGLLMVLDPKVSRELMLTDDQKRKIEALHARCHKEVVEALYMRDKEARAAKLEDLRKAQGKMLADVLTDGQKAKWKDLKGEQFAGKFIFEDLRVPGKDKK